MSLNKKALVLFLCLCMLTAVLCGCANQAKQDDGKIHIITTLFPYYDFARNVAGDLADVSLLLPPGMESHSYEPTPKDMISIQACDLFVFTGGESDTWADEILGSMEMHAASLRVIDTVEAVQEELTDGMQAERGSDEDAEEAEYDEHVWTSPRNAALIALAIADALAKVDPDHADEYRQNARVYSQQLFDLNDKFSHFFDECSGMPLIFGDRFPFRYFAEEYGLECYAAFPGCSSQTEPSAATMAYLINKVRSTGCKTVFYIEFSNHLVADSIAEATGVETAMFHSCHNVSRTELDGGVSYISLMEQNLETLKGAFD